MSLPTQIDPRKLALQGLALEGELAAKGLTRLGESVEAITGPLKASLQFSLDESRQPMVTGKASVCVDVICQRCLDIMNIEVKAAIALQVVWSEDHIANVAPDYEPWIVVDKIADLDVVIEDEILLALPIVNYHKIGECTGSALYRKADINLEEATVDSPFSVLQQLKS
ncbi:MAG: Large ribosomal RNA subunit accumulation protein YceD [Cellvibrionales bacterium UBA7375]|nr:MAG: Large ribosomal RNA subunit accumulation protein YceD [Cellvibrionales bacterium UBA7375]